LYLGCDPGLATKSLFLGKLLSKKNIIPEWVVADGDSANELEMLTSVIL